MGSPLSTVSSFLGVCLPPSVRLGMGQSTRYLAHSPVGHVGSISGRPRRQLKRPPEARATVGCGIADSGERAEVVAIAEAMERYASAVYRNGLVFAAADDLDSALDLDRLPRMSMAEMEDRRCTFAWPDTSSRIRWMPATRISDGAAEYVPSVIPLSLPSKYRAERFWVPISTGTAAHFNRDRALLSGLCEVLERDAIALTWLQRLPLSEVSAESLGEETIRKVEWNRAHHIETHLFDATSLEFAVPTIYCLLIAPYARRAAHVVGACTALTGPAAAAHAIDEALGTMSTVYLQEPPADAMCCRNLMDGAAYMGEPHRRSAFDFLLAASREGRIKDFPDDCALPSTPARALEEIVSRLTRAGAEPVATDISTDECKSIGVSVVHVLVPELQPMSYIRAAQYRGHRRLYEGPAAAGFAPAEEEGLNPWPQPFA